MSIKRILVPLSGNSADATVLEAAAEITKLFDGHLEALHVRPDVQRRLGELAYGEGGSVVEGMVREAIDAAELAAKRARSAFEAIMHQHAIRFSDHPVFRPAASWRDVVDGDDVLVHDGGFIDLIVMGWPSQDSMAAKMFDTALFTSGHTVLITPSDAQRWRGERVLVGWNATVQSERAIVRALPFLKQAEQVVLFAIQTGAKRGPKVSEAARYLAWHEVTARVKEVPPSGRSVGAVLLDEAAAMDADLLVMGAYSHSRLREMILGGVTRYVLDHAKLPVLMAH